MKREGHGTRRKSMADIIDKKRVLVIDDDEISLKFAEVMLQNEYEVITARSGKIALEKLSHIRHGLIPDVILLDIIMPYMDGWETFYKIKSVGALKNVPVIFLTSVKETAVYKRAADMGVDDYIAKPYNREDLLKRIKEAIEKRRALP
jgi:CheY-like chemotaxis protein